MLTDDMADADIVFMNQVSSGPEHSRSAYTVEDVRAFRAINPKAKIFFRAVNLKRHGYPSGIFKYYLSGDQRTDKNIIDVMHESDFVVFQSAYQKDFFIDGGYKAFAMRSFITARRVRFLKMAECFGLIRMFH